MRGRGWRLKGWEVEGRGSCSNCAEEGEGGEGSRVEGEGGEGSRVGRVGTRPDEWQPPDDGSGSSAVRVGARLLDERLDVRH